MCFVHWFEPNKARGSITLTSLAQSFVADFDDCCSFDEECEEWKTQWDALPFDHPSRKILAQRLVRSGYAEDRGTRSRVQGGGTLSVGRRGWKTSTVTIAGCVRNAWTGASGSQSV
jgi:hypothetical protein